MSIVLSLAALAAAAAGHADPSPAPPAPPVEQFVAEALERAPSAAALAARIAAARVAVPTAGALPDPSLEMSYTDATWPRLSLGGEPMSMVSFAARQALPWPGKRAARREAARAEAEARAADLETLRRRLVREVREAYAQVREADVELAAYGAAHDLLDLLAESASARYAAGHAGQEAALAARLMAVRHAGRETDARAGRALAVAALSRLLDRREPLVLGPVAPLEAPAVAPHDAEAAALDGAAEVAARRAALVAARKKVAMLRADLRPDLSAGAATGLRGGLDPVVTLTIGIDLPLWRRSKQEPLVRAAELEAEAAQHELAEAEAAVRGEVRRIAAERERAREQRARLDEGVLPLARAAFAAARTEYLAGNGAFTTVADDFTTWLDAEVEAARLAAADYGLWAALDEMTSPAPRPTAAGGDR